jgi:myo-inositol-1(or 4)-monophosphatase
MSDRDDYPHDGDRYDDGTSYAALGAFAVELARYAGERVERTLDTEIQVTYKDKVISERGPIDVVTNLDRELEAELVERIHDGFPDHAILGEEGTRHFPDGAEYLWALDPIDGTQNFVNGLPIFSCSVALLRHGEPVAGAIWGASSHRLRPGVYHAHRGSALRFDGEDIVTARASRGKVRGLGAMPHDQDQRVHLDGRTPPSDHALPWDRRHIGSGALEAAFVAAGVLESAFNTGPRSWDIAAGALLVRAAGRGIWHLRDGEWRPLERFAETPQEIADWQYPVLMATDAAYAQQLA